MRSCRFGRFAAVAVAVTVAIAACADGQQPAPVGTANESTSRQPSYHAEHDSIPLLSAERINSLPPAERAAWQAYIARSESRRAADTAAMNSELRRIGKSAMVAAPFAAGLEITKGMTPAWFATDSARQMAENILSYQAPNGGWSKHVDLTRGPRAPGQSYFSENVRWQWISTIDNSATTSEMQFLALADSARPDPRYRAAFLRGVDYLVAAQFPNGCWPQVWPLAGSYHDAATFNDDATTHVLELLDDVAAGRIAFAPADQRASARVAVDHGIECILRAQVRVGEILAAWGQQHDPLTLAPTSARSYELTSLASQESANIMRFLMTLPSPPQRVIASIEAAARWLEARRVYGYTFDFASGRHDSAGAGPVWARLYEIGTNRPIFSDRNGVKLYDWNQLDDRRHGYGWYSYVPASALREYAKWRRRG